MINQTELVKLPENYKRYIPMLNQQLRKHGIFSNHFLYKEAYDAGIYGITLALSTYNKKKSSKCTWVYFGIRQQIQCTIGSMAKPIHQAYESLLNRDEKILYLDSIPINIDEDNDNSLHNIIKDTSVKDIVKEIDKKDIINILRKYDRTFQRKFGFNSQKITNLIYNHNYLNTKELYKLLKKIYERRYNRNYKLKNKKHYLHTLKQDFIDFCTKILKKHYKVRRLDDKYDKCLYY